MLRRRPLSSTPLAALLAIFSIVAVGAEGGCSATAENPPRNVSEPQGGDAGVQAVDAKGSAAQPGASPDGGREKEPPPVFYDVGGPIGTWVDVTPPGVASAIGVGLSPAAPNVLYVDGYADYPVQHPDLPSSGLYKSKDGGNTWAGPIGKSFINYDGSAYTGTYPWKLGVSWSIEVDPTNADIVYAMCAFSGPQGPWKSTDGGDTWRSILSGEDSQAMTADVYKITIDPRDRLHVLMTFHSGWANGSHAGVAESTDGGATWIKHPPQGAWGAGHYAFFLGEDDDGTPSSAAWILATQANGFWRTMDAGKSFTQVSSAFSMQHGAGGMYRASSGVLYMGAVGHLIRSTDNGKTWTDAGAPSNQDGYNAVIGDGTRMFVQSANTGTNTTGPQPFFTSLETDGSAWSAFNEQTFADGPGWMAADRANKIIFASNWDHGLWRLRTGN